ncbi:fibroblast growth factor-binding protein 1 [Misgurnus anguillicaudatus]|uniref:fibroblast growth factor-binding protein 1 n=1 Tax=Misgurnus anguillicaudatus TaxID=75329 RepID=UPI002435CCFA|nr:fibroblast growth factor-binding protein 1 [Misgurnus anguillicaudatus]
MSFLKNLALLLFLTCLSQLIFTAESVKGPERKGKRQERRGDGGLPLFKGKFKTSDKVQCSWVARGEDTYYYTLTVTCKPGKRDGLTCNYTGKPSSCPEFASNTENYWKQISRSLKKQKKLCVDPRSMLRAGMCKSAPLEAHFRLSETEHAKSPKKPIKNKEVKTNATMPDSTRKCTPQIDHSKTAKEKCGDSWASLCTFVFTLIQNGDC